MRQLQRRVGSGELPGFRFVEINGLRLPTPHHAYSRLYEALTGEQVAPTRAAELLESHFSSNGGKSTKGANGKAKKILTVVLLDEMDLMVTRRQSVLYSFFDWPMRPGANLAVIGIANTMDLPERLLPRIASRLGQRRVQFMPYNSAQIREIIESRLRALPAFCRSGNGNGMFEDNAMEFVSKKVRVGVGRLQARPRDLPPRRRHRGDAAEAEQQRRRREAGGHSLCLPRPRPQVRRSRRGLRRSRRSVRVGAQGPPSLIVKPHPSERERKREREREGERERGERERGRERNTGRERQTETDRQKEFKGFRLTVARVCSFVITAGWSRSATSTWRSRRCSTARTSSS